RLKGRAAGCKSRSGKTPRLLGASHLVCRSVAPQGQQTRKDLPVSREDSKSDPGRFFEDFRLGQVITHATARTLTEADAVLYLALYGTRFAVQASVPFAAAIGYRRAPCDDLLVFHVVFGKTVADISLNA